MRRAHDEGTTPVNTDTPIRPELEALPLRMKLLPVDERGYPVPWFVAWVGGKPDHRILDPRKWALAVQTKRCWTCGAPLGANLSFVLGPMCGITRTTAEPPNHFDCAVYAARNCPFLSRPHAHRRTDDGTVAALDNVAGSMLTRNPGVVGVWTTKRFRVFSDDKGRPLLSIGDPSSVMWFAAGRLATRDEVLLSVRGGFPELEKIAIAQDTADPSVRALDALHRQSADFLTHIPAAV
jgi:hypothetical protein